MKRYLYIAVFSLSHPCVLNRLHFLLARASQTIWGETMVQPMYPKLAAHPRSKPRPPPRPPKDPSRSPKTPQVLTKTPQELLQPRILWPPYFETVVVCWNLIFWESCILRPPYSQWNISGSSRQVRVYLRWCTTDKQHICFPNGDIQICILCVLHVRTN